MLDVLLLLWMGACRSAWSLCCCSRDPINALSRSHVQPTMLCCYCYYYVLLSCTRFVTGSVWLVQVAAQQTLDFDSIFLCCFANLSSSNQPSSFTFISFDPN